MLGRSRAHFERAEAAYERAIALIRSLDEAFQSRAFRSAPEQRYDTEVTLYQFDLILQAILLKMALVDGDFHRLERRFILRITAYGDLLPLLRREIRPGLQWDDLATLEEGEREKLLTLLPALLSHTCDSFVLPLARADAVDPEDFLARLEGELTEIAGEMSAVDGQRKPEEQAAFRDMTDHLLRERWRAIVAQELKE
ncbi:MAG: hypothetical protein IJ751_06780 [Oscillospiraceae bacterium]|nr:hypothetical protein [Oscillospiraceae bacterium]